MQNRPNLNEEYLRSFPLFERLSEASLRAIIPHLEWEEFSEGELIFSEGQRGDRLFLVAEGRVQISREIEGVGENLLAILERGDFFGELSLLDGNPRSSDARALSPVLLLALHKSSLEELFSSSLEISSELTWAFLRNLVQNLRQIDEKLRALYQMQL